MSRKAVINLSIGLEDPQKVTVAFLVALGAVACEGCPLLAELGTRNEAGDVERVAP